MSAQTINNLTPKRLRITGRDDNILVLAPLEKERPIDDADKKLFDFQKLKRQNLISISDAEKSENLEDKFSIVFKSAVFLTFAFFVVRGILISERPELDLWFWYIGIPVGLVILIIIGVFAFIERTAKYLRSFGQFVSFLLIAVIGIGLPGGAIYFFGGGQEFFRNGEATLAMFGRVLQVIFLVVASLLPGLLYFLFDRQKLGTLRDKFEQQIFRLDPNVETLVDVQAKYGKQLEEIYGSGVSTGDQRLIRTSRSPIFVATVVITLGWILTLLPADRALVIEKPGEILKLFLPQQTGVVFAFLGAYFFALNTILRRYIRADLKPKAYSSITVRIFIVIILGWVIGVLFGNESPYVLVFVFLVGIFPESGLTLIQESIRKQKGFGKVIPYTKEEHPLTNLEEIDVYDRARLLDEGVTNIESLAHHDMVDLMLETRIPVARLVDWVDQAILYLHLPDHEKEEEPDEADEKSKDAKKTKQSANSVKSTVSATRQKLHKYGIRTTTDFIRACKDGDGSLCKVFADNDAELHRLQIVLDVLGDDEWLNYIVHWRNNCEIKEDEECFAPAAAEETPAPSAASAAEKEVQPEAAEADKKKEKFAESE